MQPLRRAKTLLLYVLLVVPTCKHTNMSLNLFITFAYWWFWFSGSFEVASFEASSSEVASSEAASFGGSSSEVAFVEVASFEAASFEAASFESSSFEAARPGARARLSVHPSTPHEKAWF